MPGKSAETDGAVFLFPRSELLKKIRVPTPDLGTLKDGLAAIGMKGKGNAATARRIFCRDSFSHPGRQALISVEIAAKGLHGTQGRVVSCFRGQLDLFPECGPASFGFRNVVFIHNYWT